MGTQTRLYANYSIGSDCYQEVNRFCTSFGTRVLLIGGKTGMEQGMPELESALGGGELHIVAKEIYGTECTYQRIRQLSEKYRNQNVHMVFGMGGGKAMDTAKGVAWELGVPVFTFPTIASNCAAMAALSVVYREDNSFDSFYFYERPAVHCFINTRIMAKAPLKYIRAGMGDTIGKFFECHFSARGDRLDFHSALGKEISNLCFERLRVCGPGALSEIEQGVPAADFEQVVLTIVVNTGLVSHLVEDCYNCAVAHSVCYGLNLIRGLEERYLHGDLVGYGVLVQLAIDHSYDELAEVRKLLACFRIPVSLKQLGIELDRQILEQVLEETVSGPDMEHIPYEITKDMVWEAMLEVEKL